MSEATPTLTVESLKEALSALEGEVREQVILLSDEPGQDCTSSEYPFEIARYFFNQGIRASSSSFLPEEEGYRITFMEKLS